MKVIRHPSEYIASNLVQRIRNHAAEAELLKKLHPAQLSLIHEQKWFQLFVPETCQGLGLSLPDALRLEESLAWTDGSLGWTVTLCAGAGWFVGFLTPEVASTVFNHPMVCIAGSGKSSGVAEKKNGGYKITGHWPHATGAAHATAFTANCTIEENGIPLKKEDGIPDIRSFLFLKNEVTIHHHWNSIGMKATGSFGFEVIELWVPENRVFQINSEEAYLQSPIYQYPFMSFAELTLAVNSSGMAIRFLDLCQILSAQTVNPVLQSCLKTSLKQLAECRDQFYQITENSWEYCLKKEPVSTELMTRISVSSKKLAITARRVVDELYPYCGMLAADPETEINRVWRNLHTASQHSLFNRN